MKIDKVSGGHVPHTTFQQASKKTVAPSQATSVSEPALNANTVALEKAQAELAALPDVDMAKVEQVRAALARGELSLDSKALSQALIQFHTGHE
ncbi:flagellar biosynthesis anti-sigma factor FlgM [Vibrio furnissii]|uniref:flagellar biosynthesis anti-sigma factor FlgM n=1 Tax=Vibrio furnissii TaxID=29494 RepID=UPI001EEC03D2|nr:flagellar biosynthesis anti-sigma factor FlgM [Vibrio furnissii]MCG6231774.1 flagellar biosynthesis anti-sigma factor FlgM [Vibrio furnissii]MCG6257356.1 flagellar biosynthesis anti-sigma factor FlgM [Vibrio furnissii]